MRVLANHPVSIPYHGLGFNITLMSYRGQLDYGLTADRDAVPDIERFGELMHESLTHAMRAHRQPSRPSKPDQIGPIGKTPMPQITANGIQLEYETLGDPAASAGAAHHGTRRAAHPLVGGIL